MKTRTLIFILLILLFVIHAGLVNAEDFDWPRWRGPNGDGISTETAWNPEALNRGPKIMWKVNVGLGHSNVAIKDNFLYTMGLKGGENIVFCLKLNAKRTHLYYNKSDLKDVFIDKITVILEIIKANIWRCSMINMRNISSFLD